MRKYKLILLIVLISFEFEFIKFAVGLKCYQCRYNEYNSDKKVTEYDEGCFNVTSDMSNYIVECDNSTAAEGDIPHCIVYYGMDYYRGRVDRFCAYGQNGSLYEHLKEEYNNKNNCSLIIINRQEPEKETVTHCVCTDKDLCNDVQINSAITFKNLCQIFTLLLAWLLCNC